jgi:hypothetical protein
MLGRTKWKLTWSGSLREGERLEGHGIHIKGGSFTMQLKWTQLGIPAYDEAMEHTLADTLRRGEHPHIRVPCGNAQHACRRTGEL